MPIFLYSVLPDFTLKRLWIFTATPKCRSKENENLYEVPVNMEMVENT